MSARDQQIRKRMRDAGIIPNALGTTLEIEEQKFLREIVIEKQFESDKGYASYVIQAGDAARGTDVAFLTYVMAKELVLMGVNVRCTSLTEIRRELRLEIARPDFEPEVLDRRGNGYLVIPDFLHTRGLTESEMDDITQFLSSHVWRGGGLILGAGIWVAATATEYGAEFSAFARSFQDIQIKIR